MMTERMMWSTAAFLLLVALVCGCEPKPETKPEAPKTPEPKEFVLYTDYGDTDGDGQAEQVQIVSFETSDPSKESKMCMVIRKRSGTDVRTVFRTDPFTYRFATHMNDLVQEEQSRCGVHVRASQARYAEIFIVFTPASGDGVAWQYDGKTYKLIWEGD